MTAEHDLDGDIHIEADIQLGGLTLAEVIATDQDAIALLAEAVRKSQVRQARGKGNAFGNWAQTKPKPKAVQPNTVQRIF